jgi:acyl-CoA thioesterase FadM
MASLSRRLGLTAALAGCAVLAVAVPAAANGKPGKPRTVVTTDMEQDDYASLIRYLLYTNDLDTEGIVYTASRFHWAGDGKGTEFFLPGREYPTPQTSWRWTGTRTIQDQALAAYARVYPNLRRQDPAYPRPADLLRKVKVGNVDFEGEMSHDTPGSNLIRDLLLDHDPRPVYLQAWGGTNTIARALRSIEERYPHDARIKARVSRKAVILASGFQDETYANYIAPNWPALRVEQLSAGYATWGYNCNAGKGNTRGLPADHVYFTGDWIKKNIQIGPYGKLYRSWLDGQSMPGDPLDIFGDPAKAPGGWCKPLGPYDFLSEGDNVAFNPLLNTGLQNPADPALGGWGGQATRTTASPDLWTMVADPNTTLRWAGAAQNDFAARMSWTLTGDYRKVNHAPSVKIVQGDYLRVRPGASVTLSSRTHDPDGARVSTTWWQYREEGTYPGAVAITGSTVEIPADAQRGQTISIVLQGTDDGQFPLTRYDRMRLVVG